MAPGGPSEAPDEGACLIVAWGLAPEALPPFTSSFWFLAPRASTVLNSRLAPQRLPPQRLLTTAGTTPSRTVSLNS